MNLFETVNVFVLFMLRLAYAYNVHAGRFVFCFLIEEYSRCMARGFYCQACYFHSERIIHLKVYTYIYTAAIIYHYEEIGTPQNRECSIYGLHE